MQSCCSEKETSPISMHIEWNLVLYPGKGHQKATNTAFGIPNREKAESSDGSHPHEESASMRSLNQKHRQSWRQLRRWMKAVRNEWKNDEVAAYLTRV